MTWDELASTSIDEIMDWAAGQPWCRAMKECAQDAGWHAEGDVWIHTQQVCRALEALAAWPTLTPRERTLLTFTALFHDSGKPAKSQVDPVSGRITSPKHAVAGERIARTALRELGCDLSIREEIARLVRFHGRPMFLLEKPDPTREVVSLSWLVTNRLLYLFALADLRGRESLEGGRSEENLELWKLVAEENNCFERPYPFANDQSRFLFYRQPESNLHFIPHESFRCTVTMLSGLPGSGKDTWLAEHASDLVVVSLDEIRSERGVEPTDDQGEIAQLARERCRQRLRERQSFAFNATNLVRQTRKRWIDLFADYGARIEIVYVEPPLAVVLDQNRRRARPIPEHVIRRLADECEPPSWTEAQGLTFVDRTVSQSASSRRD